jgi:hypothetical protein
MVGMLRTNRAWCVLAVLAVMICSCTRATVVSLTARNFNAVSSARAYLVLAGYE